MEISNINYLAVATATVASFALGALWYSPVLFSKIWQKEVGLTDENLKGANMAKIFGTCLVLTAVMAFGMALMLKGKDLGDQGLQIGLIHGLYVGVFFVAMSMGINYLYQRKSLKLFFIDAGYQITFLGLQGLIIGVWR